LEDIAGDRLPCRPVSGPGLGKSFHSAQVQDPMVWEFAITREIATLQRPLTFFPSSPSPVEERYPASPAYVPVSDLWMGVSSAGPLGGRAGPSGFADVGLEESVLFGPGVQLGTDGPTEAEGQGPLESLTDRVHGMDIDGPDVEQQTPGLGLW
jgi:hypothetical protein